MIALLIRSSYAQVSAWARPGGSVTCVGCHMGHVSGSLETNLADAEAGWQNIAPYAAVGASSYYAYLDPNNPAYLPFRPHFINDRRGWVPVPFGGPPAPEKNSGLLEFLPAILDNKFTELSDEISRHPMEIIRGPNYQDDEKGWISDLGFSVGEWIELSWPVGIVVKEIRLVGPPPVGGAWGGFGEPSQYGDYYIESGTLDFTYQGSLVGIPVVVGRVEPLENGATSITLPGGPIVVDKVRFTITSTSGR